MVEGPLLHRLAFAHRQALLGHAFKATSPSGRFADGAAAITGRVLTHIEVHGKNIFYFFTLRKVEEEGVLEKVGDDAVVVHIHLGMSGSFRTYRFPGPEPREATRLRLQNEELGVEAHLSASVCAYGDIDLYRTRLLELGPDPLREDADKEVLWASMQKTKRSIGAVLMDQSLVAGIGNIYRAEILFVVRLHPDQPANTVSRAQFEFLWDQAVRQMEIGVEVGNIITILPEDAGKPLPKKKTANQLRYVYNQKGCGKCGGVIKVWTMAQRSVYACEVCQPPPPPIITVSKRVAKKTRAYAADSELAENGGGVESEGGVTVKMPPRKRVAKGGKVVVHQAYKNENPKVLPDSFVITPDQVDSHEHLGKGGQKTQKGVQETAQMKAEVENIIRNDSDLKARSGRKGAGNEINQPQVLENELVKDSAPSEKPTERRSLRLRKQIAPKADLGTATLGFRGMLEFPSPSVTRFHVQLFPTFFGSHSRGLISICRGFNGPARINVLSSTSPLRHLICPLGRAQPIIKVATISSTVLGAVFLKGSIASLL